MKKIIYPCIFVFLFLFMIINPALTFNGASAGLLLWFQIVLPTLLPFFILTNMMIRSNSIQYISNLCYPLFHRIFQVSKNGSFAILSGFLCGYPIGAKVTADLFQTNRISLEEASYLLSFCNNTSPAFIVSYIVLQHLRTPNLLIPSICILYLSPILCSFFFRRYYKIKNIACTEPNHENSIHFSFEMIDDSIMNSFENITKVGGYIILFSILLYLGRQFSIAPVLAVLEITNGIPLIFEITPEFHIQYISAMALTSFGGFCAIAQTNSMISNTRLSIIPYIVEKLITTLVTSLLTLLYVMIILR